MEGDYKVIDPQYEFSVNCNEAERSRLISMLSQINVVGLYKQTIDQFLAILEKPGTCLGEEAHKPQEKKEATRKTLHIICRDDFSGEAIYEIAPCCYVGRHIAATFVTTKTLPPATFSWVYPTYEGALLSLLNMDTNVEVSYIAEPTTYLTRTIKIIRELDQRPYRKTK